MKRFLFCAATAAMLVNATSCQNDETILRQEGQMFTLEAAYGTGTRTTLEENGSGGYATKWSADDKIYVTDGYGLVSGVLTLKNGEGESTGTFTGYVSGNPAALRYAVFPAPTNGQIDLSEVDASQADAPMTAPISGSKANFKNECGLVRIAIFNLPENADVRLSAEGITGDLQVNTQNGVVLEPSGTADEIRIKNAKNGQAFFVPVIATDNAVSTQFTLSINGKAKTFTAQIKKGAVTANGVPEIYFSDGGLIKWEDYEPDTNTDIQNNYLLKDATDLIWLAKQINEKGRNFNEYTLSITEDIDLQGYEWTPIGNATNKFNGSFDGGGKTISNLYVNNGKNNNAGLFGFVQGDKSNKIEIKDVILENVEVKGGWRIGGLIGSCGSYTTVSDITMKGLVKIEGYSDAGAIVGGNCKNINNITINVEEGSYVQSTVGTVGGVIGLLTENYHAENITSNIDVIATDVVKANNPGVGGIFGCTNGYGTILTNCSSSGNVTIQNASTTELAQKIGGVSGGKHGGKLTLTGCSYTGKLASSYNGTPIATFNNNGLVGGDQDKNIIIK
ncbi:MAG: hypothetical protein IKU26_00080 [Clostridia bacterium]|nr:hypothetical protein [Clostridia bacterium]